MCQVEGQKTCHIIGQNACQIKCQIVRQIDDQKNDMSNVCQIECRLVGIIRRKSEGSNLIPTSCAHMTSKDIHMWLKIGRGRSGVNNGIHGRYQDRSNFDIWAHARAQIIPRSSVKTKDTKAARLSVWPFFPLRCSSLTPVSLLLLLSWPLLSCWTKQ